MDLKELAASIARDIKISTSVVDELNPNHVLEDGHSNFLGNIEKNILNSLPVILWNIKQNPDVLNISVEKPKPKIPEPIKFKHSFTFLKLDDELDNVIMDISQRDASKFVIDRESISGDILIAVWPPLKPPFKFKKPESDEEKNRIELGRAKLLGRLNEK